MSLINSTNGISTCQIDNSVTSNQGPTSSSAIAEGPRDALSLLKSCQLLHNCTKNHIWHLTKRIALSCGIKNIDGRFFGLATKHACDRRTDRQNYDSQDRASIAASRGKNHLQWWIQGVWWAWINLSDASQSLYKTAVDNTTWTKYCFPSFRVRIICRKYEDFVPKTKK